MFAHPEERVKTTYRRNTSMNRSKTFASVMLVVLALVLVTSPINAQPNASGMCPDGSEPYKVIRGDSLWKKAGGPDYEVGLARLKELNPQIADRPLVRHSADDVDFLLREGELLCGLQESGLEIRQDKAPVEKTLSGMTAILGGVTNVPDVDTDYTWILWLLVILALMLLLRRLVHSRKEREREAARVEVEKERLAEERRQARQAREDRLDEERRVQELKRRQINPTTAGPAMREGGIGNLPVDQLASYLDQLANANCTNGEGGPRFVRVSPPIKGVLMGPWMVSFRDAPPALFECDGTSPTYDAYQSFYRDTITNEIVAKEGLEGCGNDLLKGRVENRGGVFIPTGVVTALSTPLAPPTFGLQGALNLTRQLDAAGPHVENDPSLFVFTTVLQFLGVENTIEAEASAVAERIVAHRAEQLAQADRLRRELALVQEGAEEDDQSIIDLVKLAGRFGVALPNPGQQTLQLADGTLVEPASSETAEPAPPPVVEVPAADVQAGDAHPN